MHSQIIGSHSGRTAETTYAYQRFQVTYTGECAFCEDPLNQIVTTHGTMRVFRNVFPYALWDGLPVEEHLMVVPARHVLSLDEFTDTEMRDFFTLLRTHEAAGCSIYSRAPHNTSRTVGHVHTHLIKTGEGYGEQSDSLAA